MMTSKAIVDFFDFIRKDDCESLFIIIFEDEGEMHGVKSVSAMADGITLISTQVDFDDNAFYSLFAANEVVRIIPGLFRTA